MLYHKFFFYLMYLLDKKKCRQVYFGPLTIFLMSWSVEILVWESLVYMSFDPVIQLLGNDLPQIMCHKKKNVSKNTQCSIICRKQNLKTKLWNT